MGYYTGTVFHMKAKNGHDASMSWTLWNGSDADAYGNYTETLSQLGFWIGLGISSDTAPLTHGWVKTFELMTNEYGSWAD
jgi:hypothetical protein